jgi:type IV fimbrial biogenesis protein FimT
MNFTSRTIRRISGFTMIEMIIVMTIVAILLGIGVPSYKYVTTANRMSSDINGLLGDLQFARSEAIREGQAVTVCATADGATCTGAGTAWSGGWIVFVDGPVIGTIDGTDTTLRIQKQLPSQDSLQGNHTINTITFNREGFVSGQPLGGTLTLHDSAATPNAQYTRCLSFTLIGAMSTQTSGHLTAEGNSCT